MATEKYLQLVYKRLTDSLSNLEAEQLESWLQASAENRQAAAEVEAIFHASELPPPQVDVPAELAALKSRLRADAEPKPGFKVVKRSPMRFWWAAAAALTILMAAVYFLPKTAAPAVEWTSVRSGAQPGQELLLPDGSRVWLNSNSEIAFVKNIDRQQEREVRLTGEAFFEVAKNPEKPFVVDAGSCVVQVLGTSFNVRARDAEPTVSVSVLTGKVRVATAAEVADLIPGQQAVVEKNIIKRMQISTPSSTDIAEWRATDMTFQNQPLETVVLRLSRRFDRAIALENPALAGCTYSGYFPKADLAVILANLQAVFGVNINQTTTGILLEGGSCPR